MGYIPSCVWNQRWWKYQNQGCEQTAWWVILSPFFHSKGSCILLLYQPFWNQRQLCSQLWLGEHRCIPWSTSPLIHPSIHQTTSCFPWSHIGNWGYTGNTYFLPSVSIKLHQMRASVRFILKQNEWEVNLPSFYFLSHWKHSQ